MEPDLDVARKILLNEYYKQERYSLSKYTDGEILLAKRYLCEHWLCHGCLYSKNDILIEIGYFEIAARGMVVSELIGDDQLWEQVKAQLKDLQLETVRKVLEEQ